MRRPLLALFAALALSGPAACAPSPLEPYGHPQRMVTLPDGRRMNLYCLGDKGPVVVMDAGLGGSTFSWGEVQPRLSRTYRVCAYDRAGMGFSDPGPLPRDTQHMADDLRALLKVSGLPGPYILVGHSLGGMTVRLYAALYPKEVAGLVLVDPSGPRQDARMNALLGGRSPPDPNTGRKACLKAAEAGLEPGGSLYDPCVGTPPETWPPSLRAAVTRLKRDPAYHRSIVSEAEAMAGADSDQLDAAAKSLGDMPLIVLTAERTFRDGVPPAYAEMLSAEWMRMHDEIALSSLRGSNRLITGAGHLLQNDNPDAVVKAIDDVAAMARKP